MRPFGMYINGSFVQTNRTLERPSPHQPDSVFRISVMGPGDSEFGDYREAALQGAAETFEQIQDGFFPLEQRREILSRFADRLENQAEFLAKTVSLEVSKPLSLARAELRRARLTLDATLQVPLESPLYETGDWPLRIRHRLLPRGPLLAITPFNFPVNLVLHKVLPALWSGNPVVLKPSPKAHACAMVLADMFHAVHLPPGLLQVLQVDDSEVLGLAADPRIQHVSFTGSSEVGWKLQSSLNKPLTLELGGYAPVYIGARAELRQAALACVESAWNYAGQSCISAQNIFVHPSVYPEFMEELRRAAQAYTWGDPNNETTRCACLIDKASQQRLLSSVEGLKVLIRAPEFTGKIEEKAPYFHPCFVEGVSNKEVFGPLAFVTQSNFRDFLSTANAFEHRLQAAVFTTDPEEHQQSLQRLRFGGVVINEAPSTRWDPAPYGGFGKSGLGREGPAFAVAEMTQTQTWLERI